MENFLKYFVEFLEYADAHDGIIAMIGIAVTVLIFHREVTNNFFTLEKENFNDVFRSAYKNIPLNIKKLEDSSQKEWDASFEELIKTLMGVLEAANYFKYTMPYLYELLKMYVEEIEDLSRHDNWRIYRCSEKQLNLITKKSCKIIRAINNASKGKITYIIIHQSWIARKIRLLFLSFWVNRPYDRIASCVVKASYQEAVEFRSAKGENYTQEELGALKWGHLHVFSKSGCSLIRVVPIQSTGVIRFGYMGNIRFGKKMGVIKLKTPIDKRVKIVSKRQIVKIDWDDKGMHKVVVIWKNTDDDSQLFYDTVKIRRDTE